LLSLLSGLAEKETIPRDITRTQLYERTLRHMLGGGDRAGDWLGCLPELAWRMFIHKGPTYPSEDLSWFLSQRGPERPEREADGGRSPIPPSLEEIAAWRRAELRKKRVLVATGPDRRAIFSHRTFTEFLTARYLADIINREGWKLAIVRWEE